MAELPLADRHDTVLPPPPAELERALAEAVAQPVAARREAVAEVAARAPAMVGAWAELAVLGRDPVERYAYARVGYHRGLDALRAAGWGGRGLVRFSQPGNRAFLTCLVRLRAAAREIGEAGEVERISGFLADLDPDWDEANVPE